MPSQSESEVESDGAMGGALFRRNHLTANDIRYVNFNYFNLNFTQTSSSVRFNPIGVGKYLA